MSTAIRISVDEYDRMIDAGVFVDQDKRRRVELIQGEIVEMTPIGPPHEEIVDRLSRWSIDSNPASAVRVRIQNSVGLPELDSVPEPDLSWVKPRSYLSGRPTAEDVYLLIEVADSSLQTDLKVKAPLFAAAGIRECWIVDVNGRKIHVLRDPRPDGYASEQVVESGEQVAPLAFPSSVLEVRTLFE
ncbi:MAG: Uma2 family endonuclease [Planctomycetaceae bacterium]|nr:MAG: Uma2 family endonuclease [Planctomycetaceae bacterium]